MPGEGDPLAHQAADVGQVERAGDPRLASALVPIVGDVAPLQAVYDRLAADPEVTKLLSADELTACFDLEEQLRHVDAIFERVLGKEGRV